eukprot:TRINITY_DN114660_c0_g1_i1.p1 TRINITY_DN114660_c0_g1~~TRINITY_DN114660_c0_g1_i1.p1  ORF type:complete len:206 (-),score=6.09 TRINITY_DN114660_c0_g1_i1:86-703(-)
MTKKRQRRAKPKQTKSTIQHEFHPKSGIVVLRDVFEPTAPAFVKFKCVHPNTYDCAKHGVHGTDLTADSCTTLKSEVIEHVVAKLTSVIRLHTKQIKAIKNRALRPPQDFSPDCVIETRKETWHTDGSTNGWVLILYGDCKRQLHIYPTPHDAGMLTEEQKNDALELNISSGDAVFFNGGQLPHKAVKVSGTARVVQIRSTRKMK